MKKERWWWPFGRTKRAVARLDAKAAELQRLTDQVLKDQAVFLRVYEDLCGARDWASREIKTLQTSRRSEGTSVQIVRELLGKYSHEATEFHRTARQLVDQNYKRIQDLKKRVDAIEGPLEPAETDKATEAAE